MGVIKMESWNVCFVNDLDSAFGCNPGVGVCKRGLDKAAAKSVARHLNKEAPDFMNYFAEAEKKCGFRPYW